MGILTRLDNGFQAFKSALMNSDVPPYYSRLNDGTHSYNYETERFGILGILGLGSEFKRSKENLKYYYTEAFFLQDCINLYCDFASQVKIMEVDEKGNEVKNSEYLKFLDNPNPFQNRTEFIKEMVINLLSTGGSFQNGNFFKNGNMRVNPYLYNLEYNSLAFPKIKNRYAIKRNEIQNLIIKEKLADSKTRDIPFSELVYFYDTIPNNGYGVDGYNAEGFFKPMSRIFSIISPLNTLLNAQSSMEYISGNNVNKVVFKKQLTGGSLTPLDNEQKQDIEIKVNGRGKYGARAGKIGDTIASNEDLGVLDLTRDARKMMLIEMKESAKEDVRNCLLVPKDFFGDSTYENKQHAEARLILGGVKSITDSWLDSLVNRTPLYFEVRGTKLIGTYDHLPSVAETKKALEAKSFIDNVAALNEAITAYDSYKLSVDTNISWDDFLIINQLDKYLMR